MSKSIEVGSVWFTGNSLYPTRETVRALRAWDALPAKEKEIHRTICYWLTEAEFSAQTFVVTRSNRGITSSELSVFEATRYASVDAMIAAYGAA